MTVHWEVGDCVNVLQGVGGWWLHDCACGPTTWEVTDGLDVDKAK